METYLVRRSTPNKYDHAPHGTKCKVMLNETEYEMYIQTSADDEDPKWELIEFYCELH